MLQYIKHVEEINLQSFHRYKAGFQFSGNINRSLRTISLIYNVLWLRELFLLVLSPRHNPKNGKSSLQEENRTFSIILCIPKFLLLEIKKLFKITFFLNVTPWNFVDRYQRLADSLLSRLQNRSARKCNSRFPPNFSEFVSVYTASGPKSTTVRTSSAI